MNDTESDRGDRDCDEDAFLEALNNVAIPEELVSCLLNIPEMARGGDRAFPILDHPSPETQNLETQKTVMRGPFSHGLTWKRGGLVVVVAASLLGVMVSWRWLEVMDDSRVPAVALGNREGDGVDRSERASTAEGESVSTQEAPSSSAETIEQRLVDIDARGDLLRASLEQMSDRVEFSELRRRFLTTVRCLPAREHHALALAVAAETKLQWSGSSGAVMETLREVASHFPETRGGELANNLLSY